MRDIEEEVREFTSKYFENIKWGSLINLAKYPDDFLYHSIVNINNCENDDENFVVSLMSVMTILTVKKCKTYFTIKGFTIGAIIGILFMYFMG